MADQIRDLLFRFLGDADDLKRATRGARRDLDDTDRSVGKAKQGWSNLNKTVAGFAAAVGVAEVGRFAFDAAKMAAAAEKAAESAGKVLGPALGVLHDDLEGTRQVMGLNIGELDQIVARFGLLTEGFGLTDEAQGEFVTNLITTGGELAAFRGNVGDAPEAIDALGAAIRGEFDPLEQFGVKLSQSAIKERALALAADPANAALSDQELQIAALESLIREKAGPAFGSLADAEDTLAGKTNDATARFEDLKIQLGERLVPALSATFDWLISSFEAWDRLTNPDTFENTQLGAFLKKLKQILDDITAPLRWIEDKLDTIQNARLPGWLGGATLGGTNTAAAVNPKTKGKFQTGGRVPGPVGAPVDITAHGGEIVSNPRFGQNGGGGSISVTVNAGVGDPQEIARKVVEVLEVYNRTNGALPLTVRGVE